MSMRITQADHQKRPRGKFFTCSILECFSQATLQRHYFLHREYELICNGRETCEVILPSMIIHWTSFLHQDHESTIKLNQPMKTDPNLHDYSVSAFLYRISKRFVKLNEPKEISYHQ